MTGWWSFYLCHKRSQAIVYEEWRCHGMRAFVSLVKCWWWELINDLQKQTMHIHSILSNKHSLTINIQLLTHPHEIYPNQKSPENQTSLISAIISSSSVHVEHVTVIIKYSRLRSILYLKYFSIFYLFKHNHDDLLVFLILPYGQ